MSEYWKAEKFSNRDEFYVVLNAYFGLIGAINQNPENNEWRLKFDVASLFQLKSNAQSAKSIELLVSNKCYADAFVICRTLISRSNLLIICALNPNLFDVWLKNPKDRIFLDGKIRTELKNNNISLPIHLYEFYSEITHGHIQGLGEVGYFEQGLFADVKPAENQVWVAAKFIMATFYFTTLCMLIQDCDGKAVPNCFKHHEKLFEWLQQHYLVHNRIDQIWTFLLEDRHMEKVGEDEYIFIRSYDFNGLREVITEFHKESKTKKLSPKYNIG